MFGGATTVVADVTTEDNDDLFKKLGNIDLVVLTGQFTRDERSGVDLLIVGDINQTQASKYVAELEKKEGKEVRYVIMAAAEFSYRRKLNDRFLVTVLESKKQILTDKNNLLAETTEPEQKEE